MAKDSGYPAVAGGNERVDFVWGNFPMQPNEDRTDGTASVVVAVDAAQNYDWSGYTVYPSGRLDAAADSHAIALAGYAGYPAFIESEPNYIVTAASGNGTTVTYTSQNNLLVGDTVTITGLPTSAFNLSSVVVASADKVKFTVTNAATGAAVYGARGRVESISATDDGAYISGVAYIAVPNVLGLVTAAAVDDLKDAGFGTVTTASAATNSAKTVTAASRTSGSTTITLTASSHGYVAGNKVTITSVDASVNGTYTVVTAATNTFTVTGTATTALALTGLTGSVVAVTGTIKAQSVAAGAGSIAAGASVTVTPWA